MSWLSPTSLVPEVGIIKEMPVIYDPINNYIGI
jgi:hypothetical protein